MDGADLYRTPRVAPRRIADIEVLRAIAVLLVLDEHAPLNLVFWHSRLLDLQLVYFRGWVGVDLFFAISGFVIARSLLPELRGCRGRFAFLAAALRFWTRRAWRLLPAAWLWLAIPLVAVALFNRSGAFGPFQASYEAAVAAVLQVANFRLAEAFGTRPTGVSFAYWSLSLEEQFYLVLPVAAFLLRRWLTPALLLVAALQFQAPHTPLAMMTRSGALAFGVLLAQWEGRPSWRMCEPGSLSRSRLARGAAVLGALLLLGALGSDELHIASCRLGLIALLAAGLVWVASYDRDLLLRPGPLKRALVWIGARSYALYLIHVPAYFAAHEVWFRLAPPGAVPHGWLAWAYALAALAALFLLADLTYRLVEVPLRRKGRRIAAGIGRVPALATAE